MSNLVQLVHFDMLGDGRGMLVALEECRNIPFEVKRVYYIYATQQGLARGFHAHRKLQQLAVCVSGSCRMILDNGHSREEVWLDKPNKGIMIGALWHEMHDFSDDCVLLVLASDYYDESDYIRDYDEFLKNVRK